MKAIFEVKSIENQWRPPFRKKMGELSFEAANGEKFDRIRANGNDEAVFTLIDVRGGRALVEYCRLFTLKGDNPGNRRIWLSQGEPVELTYLWGEDGITKKIKFTGSRE
ncbi:MAG: hypothetical protein V1676_00480 [Candidatus Diapherotrites archaeon]